MSSNHVQQFHLHQTGRFGELYVNDDRWCPRPTPEGDRPLPEAWPTILLCDEEAEPSFIETDSRLSDYDKTFLGLVSPPVVADTVVPDPGLDYEQEVRGCQRDGTSAQHAEIFLDWLTDNPLERSWGVVGRTRTLMQGFHSSVSANSHQISCTAAHLTLSGSP